MTMKSARPIETCAILAAGAGSRIAPLNADRPKIMLPIGNAPLAARQFEMLSVLGVKRIFFVSGGRAIEPELRKLLPADSEFHFVLQPDAQGIAHSLSLLEEAIEGCFMLLLGDIFLYEPALRKHLHEFPDSDAEALLFASENAEPEAVSRSFAVITGEDGDVLKVIEKPAFHVSDTRGCGVYLFRQSIFDAIRRTPRSELRNEFELTDAIQILIDSGARVMSAPPAKWEININTPEDLLLCNLMLSDVSGSRIISHDAELHPGAVVTRSVIGAGAKVKNPIHIRNSLIAENTLINDEKDMENTIVFGSSRYHCALESI